MWRRGYKNETENVSEKGMNRRNKKQIAGDAQPGAIGADGKESAGFEFAKDTTQDGGGQSEKFQQLEPKENTADADFDTDEFFKFIKEESERIAKQVNNKTKKEEILAHAVKLMEECGEFASEVLISLKNCRPEKIRDNSSELAKEFADVAIVLFILADSLGINAGAAIKTKMEIIKSRHIESGRKKGGVE
jgi:NTP pyrophosphatase (non-canonical NTP hydrolase)